MCSDNHSIFDLPGALNCLGVGPGHARQYQASDAPDLGHDASEQRAEAEHG